MIFDDGAARRLTRKELRLFFAGLLTTVPRDNARHFNDRQLVVPDRALGRGLT